MKEKSPASFIPQVIKFASDLLDTLVMHSDAKIEMLKRKAIHYILIYGLFLLALVFIFIGLIKYLTEIFVFPTEGIGFMVIGSVMIVILSTYSMLKKM